MTLPPLPIPPPATTSGPPPNAVPPPNTAPPPGAGALPPQPRTPASSYPSAPAPGFAQEAHRNGPTQPPAPGAGAPEPKKPPRKRRTWIITVAAVAAVGLLVAAGLMVSAENARQREVHAAATAELTAAEAAFTESLDLAETVIGVSGETAARPADDLDDAELLPALTEAMEQAGAVVAQAQEHPVLSVEGSSPEAILEAAGELDGLTQRLEEATSGVNGAVQAVEADAAAKAERLEQERQAAAEAERKAQEEERLAQEAAALAEQKAQAATISYEELFRAGNSVVGTYYKFEGEVIQDAGKDGEFAVYRVNMTRDPGYSMVFWQDTIMVAVIGEPAQRILEDDIIAFTGASMGITSYETIFGATVEIPLVKVDAADVSYTGRSD